MTKLSKEENKNAWLEQMKMKVTIPWLLILPNI